MDLGTMAGIRAWSIYMAVLRVPWNMRCCTYAAIVWTWVWTLVGTHAMDLAMDRRIGPDVLQVTHQSPYLSSYTYIATRGLSPALGS